MIGWDIKSGVGGGPGGPLRTQASDFPTVMNNLSLVLEKLRINIFSLK